MPRIISDEEEIKYVLIDPGEYLVEIQESTNLDKDGILRSDKKSNEIWNLKLAIADEGIFWGKFIYDNIVFSVGLASRTKSIFNAFGFNTSAGLEISDPKCLIGRSARAKIEHTEYKGQKKNSVVFFNGYCSVDGNFNETKKTEEDDIPF
jgi:hypothetical protein